MSGSGGSDKDGEGRPGGAQRPDERSRSARDGLSRLGRRDSLRNSLTREDTAADTAPQTAVETDADEEAGRQSEGDSLGQEQAEPAAARTAEDGSVGGEEGRREDRGGQQTAGGGSDEAVGGAREGAVAREGPVKRSPSTATGSSVRLTVDLSKDQHAELTYFSARSRFSRQEIVRALLARLGSDEQLAESITDDLVRKRIRNMCDS